MMANDKAIPGDGPMVMIVDENDEAYSPGGRNRTDDDHPMVDGD